MTPPVAGRGSEDTPYTTRRERMASWLILNLSGATLTLLVLWFINGLEPETYVFVAGGLTALGVLVEKWEPNWVPPAVEEDN